MKQFLFVFLFAFRGLLGAQAYNIIGFGAVGDGSTDNTAAIQATVDSCSHHGGGIVEVPAGKFVTGTIVLKSNVTIYLDSAAEIDGSTSMSKYPDKVSGYLSMTSSQSQKSLFYAENEHNIRITGKGKIDGNGGNFTFLNPLNKNKRPKMFRFISCNNISVKNLYLENSAFWLQHYMNCDSVSIDSLTIYNHSNKNQDGIDIDGCRNVRISHCTIDSDDDAIALKSTSPASCENVMVSDCQVASNNFAIKMGTETVGGFQNITLQRITIVPSSVYSSTYLRQEAEAGLNIAIVDGGLMDSVLIDQVTMSGVQTPIFIRLGNRASQYAPGVPVPPVGVLKNVTISNVSAVANNNVTSSVTGMVGYYAENILLKNISITIPGGEPAGPTSVPESDTTYPRPTIFGSLPAWGLYARHVKNLTLDNYCVTYNQTDNRQFLVYDDVIQSAGLTVTQSGVATSCVTGSTTFVSGLSEKNSLIAYPSPSNGLLHVILPFSSRSSEIKIFDATGRQIIYEQIISGELTHDLVLKNLPDGIYLLMCTDEDKQASSRFMIQK